MGAVPNTCPDQPERGASRVTVAPLRHAFGTGRPDLLAFRLLGQRWAVLPDPRLDVLGKPHLTHAQAGERPREAELHAVGDLIDPGRRDSEPVCDLCRAHQPNICALHKTRI